MYQPDPPRTGKGILSSVRKASCALFSQGPLSPHLALAIPCPSWEAVLLTSFPPGPLDLE